MPAPRFGYLPEHFPLGCLNLGGNLQQDSIFTRGRRILYSNHLTAMRPILAPSGALMLLRFKWIFPG
jgi:hypothetical protein